MDRIAYRIDMRERAMAIAPQPAITKDNVSVDVSGILYIQFVDPAQAAYGSFSASRSFVMVDALCVHAF